MFDRPKSGERAVLVHIDIGIDQECEPIDEFQELALSAGAEAVATVTVTRKVPTPGYFIGSGKLEEIRALVEQSQAEVALFNHSLTPAQERNLERELKCRVLDRNGLILDIFAQRARTHEGRLQVELAQLEHISTRLVRGWTHLERQKGGIGLRGPGETQLETDRRLLGERIKQLYKRLNKVTKRRDQSRRSRRKAEMHTVSLVGYTNAGKSTLFNQLTCADVYAADQLFATLDPTLRRIRLPNAKPVILADTVGFIRHLPHHLIAAFRSTLEETCEASLLLHIVDAHSDNRHANIEQVNQVLKEIGAEQVPQIEVYNKVDLLPDQGPRIETDRDGRVTRVWVSAVTGEGLDLLIQAIGTYFNPLVEVFLLRLPPSAGRLRAKLYDTGKVLKETVMENNELMVEVEMSPDQFNLIRQQSDYSETMRVSEGTKRLAGAA